MELPTCHEVSVSFSAVLSYLEMFVKRHFGECCVLLLVWVYLQAYGVKSRASIFNTTDVP